MPEYRRLQVPGATYFFTVNLADRSSDLLVREIGCLRKAVAQARAHQPFSIEAWVVLPDHLHAIWTLPDGDTDFSTRWASIKRLFSWQVPGAEHRSVSRTAKRERGLWQRRFWEHKIRDDADFRAYADDVHFNPIKHGLVNHVADWPHSTFHRAVRRGDLPATWTTTQTLPEAGECAPPPGRPP